MCDFIYDCGGASSSTSFQSTFNQLTSSTSNYITKNSSSASSAIQAYQTASIEIWGDVFPGCTINQSQTVNITSQTGVNLAQSSTQDLRNHIAASLQTAADQKADASSSTFGGSASSSTNTSVTQNIQNIVNTTVSDENYTSMSSEVMGQQDGVIKIHGNCHAPINQDQNFCANVLATNIMNQVLSQLGGLDSSTASTTTVTQSSKSVTKGPFESLASMFAQFGAIGGVICLICILMCCAGVAFLAFMMFKPKDQSP
jgi:hypothetical protein